MVARELAILNNRDNVFLFLFFLKAEDLTTTTYLTYYYSTRLYST